MPHYGQRRPTPTPKGPTWQQRLVEHLGELRHAGYAFDEAWRLAVVAAQIPARDSYSPQLFASDDDPTVIGAMRRYCESAYNGTVGPVGSGNGPALRFFRVELLEDLHISPFEMAA